MSDATAGQPAPQWDLTDRLRKSLREAGMESTEMADRLGKHRSTVSGWLNGHHAPDKPTLVMWAQITGVPQDWLIGDHMRRRRVVTGRNHLRRHTYRSLGRPIAFAHSK